MTINPPVPNMATMAWAPPVSNMAAMAFPMGPCPLHLRDARLGEDQILKALAGQRPVLHPALHGFLLWRFATLRRHAAVGDGKPRRLGGGEMVNLGWEGLIMDDDG